MQRYRQLAATKGIWLSLGGFQVGPQPPSPRSNQAPPGSADGRPAAVQAKPERPCFPPPHPRLPALQELGPDPSHLYNTHVVIDSSGELVASYRKVHLFDVDVPNGPVLMESRRARRTQHAWGRGGGGGAPPPAGGGGKCPPRAACTQEAPGSRRPSP
jgi:predicted amidohydrolase